MDSAGEKGFMLEFHFLLLAYKRPADKVRLWGIFVQHVPGIERFPRNWIRGVRPVVAARRTLGALIVIS